MTGGLSEIFFRPETIATERLTIPAPLYNQCRLVLAHCDLDCVFVPVRTMQIQAVVDREEVIFVDNLAYAVQDDEGGKLIRLVWVFRHEVERSDLNEPAPIQLEYYDEESRQLHTRLINEFRKSLDILEQRYKKQGCEARSRKVVPFRR